MKKSELRQIIREEIQKSINPPSEINEGLKSWILGGLLTLATLKGSGQSVYTPNPDVLDNKINKTEYYNDVLSDKFKNMTDSQLISLGLKVNMFTQDMDSLGFDESTDTDIIFKATIDYIKKYIKENPTEFGVGKDDGKIYYIKDKALFKDSK